MIVRTANQHNTQMDRMMSLKVKPQLTQKTLRNNNKKKVIRMRKLNQMEMMFKQHNNLGYSGSWTRI